MTDEPAGRGRIGVEIFEEVEKIVAAEGIARSEAFQRLSEQTGRRAGTVAANYYRIARQRGAVRPRGGAAAGGGGRRGRPRRSSGASGDVDAALARVSEAIDDLVAVVKRQQRDLSRLQEQSEQLAKLRKLLS